MSSRTTLHTVGEREREGGGKKEGRKGGGGGGGGKKRKRAGVFTINVHVQYRV